MKPKSMVKMAVDVCMTVLVLLQMAYHITGNKLHERQGAALFLLFILHHILNLNWYKGLFKGKYSAMRVLNTTVNMLLMAAMLGMMVSGIMLSREVFSFLGLRLSWLGRPLHMLLAPWLFLLLSVHLGLHWGMVLGMVRKISGRSKPSKTGLVAMRLLATVICLRGIYAFYSRKVWEEMFLLIQFAFFDYSEPAWLFFLDYIAIMGLFACIAHYASIGIRTGKLRPDKR